MDKTGEWVKLVVPDADFEELKWAQRWLQGPFSLTPKTVPMPVSCGNLLAGLSPAKAVESQSTISRLEIKAGEGIAAKIVRLLELLKSAPPVPALLVEEEIIDPPEVAQIVLSDITNDANTRVAGMAAYEKFCFGQSATEREIVQDLVYVLQGIDGKYVSFGEQGSTVVVSPSLTLAPHVKQAILQLGEMGRIYRLITRLLLKVPERSVLFQAFKAAVLTQLREYVSLAAMVDSDLKQWTLLKLMSWLSVPSKKLQYLRRIADAASHQPGHVLDVLWHFRQRRVFTGLVTILFEKTGAVWLEMVRVWVTVGKLPGDCFFAQFVEAQSGPRNRLADTVSTASLWRDQFKIDVAGVPEFVPRDLALRILDAGKASAFLRVSSVDLLEVPGIESMFHSVTSLGDDVEAVLRSRNAQILDLVLHQHRLLQECRDIKQYVLLGRGDFADSLITLAERELSKLAEEQNKFELRFFIDSAVRQSTADAVVIDRLDVWLGMSTDALALGFDVFELDYLVSPPVDVVISPDALTAYRECFCVLWRLVRCEHALTGSWRDLQALSRRLELSGRRGTLWQVGDLIQSAHSLRADLWRCIHELRAFAAYDVVETEWRCFESDVTQATCLDGIIEVHEQYLQQLKLGLFLTAADTGLRVEIEGIAVTAVRFAAALPAIIAELLSCMQAMQDVSAFRRTNMQSLLNDMHETFNDHFESFLELAEMRRNDDKQAAFFHRVFDRFSPLKADRQR